MLTSMATFLCINTRIKFGAAMALQNDQLLKYKHVLLNIHRSHCALMNIQISEIRLLNFTNDQIRL